MMLLLTILKTGVGAQDMVMCKYMGSSKNKKFVENVCELLVENIVPKYPQFCKCRYMDLQCIRRTSRWILLGRQRSIDIELARTSDGHKFPREEMLTNLHMN